MSKIPDKIKEYLSNVDIVYVTTCDKDKVPHIAIAKDIRILNDGEHIVFKSWFCVKSLENLAYNSNVAVGTYNMQEKSGYQFIGKVVSKDVEAVLNGYAPELESIEAETPQEEYKLKIKVESILELHFGTHSDKSIVKYE
jgi:predicted pyridoxine 5'-phosphate oxidase superfamily flavin-nucleotide-binding protein